jgi:hypothetical protein
VAAAQPTNTHASTAALPILAAGSPRRRFVVDTRAKGPHAGAGCLLTFVGGHAAHTSTGIWQGSGRRGGGGVTDRQTDRQTAARLCTNITCTIHSDKCD